MFEQVLFQRLRDRRRIVVRAAERFGDDFIHQAEVVEVLGRDFQRLGRLRGRRAVPPKNRRATFRTDDRVIGVFQNQHAIGHADAQRAARTAFPDHHRKDRDFE